MFKKFNIVTSFNEHIWKRYAKRCINSWLAHIDRNDCASIIVYLDGPWPNDLPDTPRIEYRMLEKNTEFMTYYSDFGHIKPAEEVPSEHAFRFNHGAFWCKVAALHDYAHISKVSNTKYNIWLDADVFVRADLTRDFWSSVLQQDAYDLVWMDRGGNWTHGETGFIGFDSSVGYLFNEMYRIFKSGSVFQHFREWHDAFVFTHLVRINAHRMYIKNLTTVPEALYPMETTPLHPLMIHFKGPMKQYLENPKYDPIRNTTNP